MRVDEPLAQRPELAHRAVDVLLRALRRDLDADRGVREHLRHAVVQVAREPLALLLGDLDHAQPLGRELFRQLHVLQRDPRRSGERLRVLLVVRRECVLALVEDLEHTETAAIARVDRRHEDGARPKAGALIGARVEARIVVWVVDAQHAAAPSHLGREAAAVEREADLAHLGHAWLAALDEHA